MRRSKNLKSFFQSWRTLTAFIFVAAVAFMLVFGNVAASYFVRVLMATIVHAEEDGDGGGGGSGGGGGGDDDGGGGGGGSGGGGGGGSGGGTGTINGAPICMGTAPAVTFDWSFNINPDSVQLIISRAADDIQVFNNFLCGNGQVASCSTTSGSFTWTDGAVNTNYNWLMYGATGGQLNELIGSGSFATPASCTGPTGTIQGYKVKMPGNTLATPPSNETVTLDGGSPTTANPYFFTGLSSGNYIVAVSVPSGWSVGYTACTNDTTFHGNSPTPGSSASVTVPSGGYVDLWWHYTPPPGTIVFAAMLDGAPWGIQGVDSVIVNGSTPNSPVSNLTVPLNSYPNAPVGSYTYNFADPPGGPPRGYPPPAPPPGAPTLLGGGTTIWTFNFVTAALTNNASCGAINVPATVTAGQ